MFLNCNSLPYRALRSKSAYVLWQLSSMSGVYASPSFEHRCLLVLERVSKKEITICNQPSSQSYRTYPRLGLPGPDLCLIHLCVPKFEYQLVQEWFPTYI